MASSSSSSVMDTSGFAQVGKFGTLSLLKSISAKRLNLPAQASGTTEGDVVVTSFGIDTEEVTFGRDPSCSVRLYYPDVAVVHCKIMFEERKAFLAVIGESGLIVDGCEVFPNQRNGASPTMIPLQNNSEIEIRGKRFRFSYPPKDMRAVLLSTPTPKSNRKLRLSMIQSAQVFSPRPSNNPRENLRILQSPLKNQFKSPTKPSGLSQPPLNAYRQTSPTPQRHQQPDDDDDDGEEEDEIVLVDGDQPRVVQEDRDLVILEDVEVTPPMPLVRVQQYQDLPPRTPPRRKSMGRNTLHRAVLIRSAQRAVIRAEEEEEEREVLETVVSELNYSDEDDEDNEQDFGDSQEDEYAQHPDQTQPSDEDVEMQDASDNESEGEDEGSSNGANNKPLWRKSLERIWPFKAPEENDDGAQGSEEDEEEDSDQPAPLPAIQTPARRTLGSFLTPQFKHPQRHGPGSNNLFNSNSPAPASGAGRFSLGGGVPRRVLVEQPWRVKDLVVPAPAEHGQPPASPGMDAPVPPSPRRAQLSEEERKAIQERRRSALREPDNFFPGGIPGMSPTKQGSSTPFTSPMKPSIPFTSLGAGPSSPPKARRTSGDEEDLDTRSLLEKMKETVEGMKKRRSLAPATPVRETGAGIGLGMPPMGSVKKLNLPPAPTVAANEGMMEVEEEPEQVAPQRMEEEEEHEDEEPEQRTDGDQEPFSLLRPEARKSLAFPEAPQLVETPPTPVAAKSTPVVPTTVELASESEENSGMELDSVSESEAVEAPKARGRSKVLRPTATTKPASKGKSTLTVAEAKARSRSASREPRRPARSKTPQRGEEEHEEEPEVPAPKAAATRRSKTDVVPGGSKRATKATKTPEIVESDDSEPPLPPPRRGRKAVASTSSNGESSQPESAPAKRGGSRTAVKKEPTEESVRPAPATKRAVRKPAAAASASEQSDSVSEIPVRKARTTAAKPAATTTAAAKKRATSKSRTAAASQDVEDSVEAVEEVPVPTKKTSIAAKGKKKADVVKEEDDDEPPLPQPKPTRGKAAGTTTKSTAGTSLKTPAVRATRSTKKTPSTAPAAMEGVDNKENEKAPGGSGSRTTEEGVTKVKVSRSRAKAVPAAGSSKTVVKDEPVEEAPKTRVMRSRARTKTG